MCDKCGTKYFNYFKRFMATAERSRAMRARYSLCRFAGGGRRTGKNTATRRTMAMSKQRPSYPSPFCLRSRDITQNSSLNSCTPPLLALCVPCLLGESPRTSHSNYAIYCLKKRGHPLEEAFFGQPRALLRTLRTLRGRTKSRTHPETSRFVMPSRCWRDK